MAKIRKDNRGGARYQKTLKTGQSRLINAIWDMCGGIKDVSEILKVPYQNPINWRNRGFVPLELVGMVSRRLAVSPEALNFEGVIGIFGATNDWGHIVACNVPDTSLQKYILAGKRPRTYKELEEDEAKRCNRISGASR